MANATAITVTTLAGNAGVAAPTADVLDTGTVAVALPVALLGRGADRTIIEVTNTAAAALKVEAVAGINPPASRAGLGAVTLAAALAQNATVVCGPFESGRFAQAAGALSILFTPASGTIGVSIRAYRLPKTV